MKHAYLILFIRPRSNGLPVVERAQIASEVRVSQVDLGDVVQATLLKVTADSYDQAHRSLLRVIDTDPRFMWVKDLMR